MAISRGDLALRPEGHAPDKALLDLQRRGSEPLAQGVEEHHAADAADVDDISRGDLALRPEGHARDLALLDLQRRRSEPLAPGVEEHHAADAAVEVAISRGDLALRPEGHARDTALGDVEEANDFRTRVERALQAPPSFEGVSLLRGFQGQQHRQVQPFRPHRIRQDRQATGFSDPGLFLGDLTLLVRFLISGLRLARLVAGLVSIRFREPPQPARHKGKDPGRHGHGDETLTERPFFPGPGFRLLAETTFAVGLFRMGLLARREEDGLHVAQVVAMRRSPFARRREAGAGVEVAVLLHVIGRSPLPGIVDEPVADTHSCPIGIDPVAQLLPAPDQRLVSYLDGSGSIRRFTLRRDQAQSRGRSAGRSPG